MVEVERAELYRRLRELLESVSPFSRARSADKALPHELEREAVPRGMEWVVAKGAGVRIEGAARRASAAAEVRKLDDAEARALAEHRVPEDAPSRTAAVNAEKERLKRARLRVTSRERSAFDVRADAVAPICAKLVELVKEHGDALAMHRETWLRLLADDLLLVENVEAALALLPERVEAARRNGLPEVAYAFVRVLIDEARAEGGRLTNGMAFERAKAATPNRFQMSKMNSHHRKVLRDLVGHENDGWRIAATAEGDGPQREFWAERIRK